MKKFLLILSFFLGLGLVIKFIPFSIEQPASITVTGEAKQNEAPQIAKFSASVVFTNQTKQTAVDLVNQSMTKIIQSIKDFGIDPKDIQTQRVSVYQTTKEKILVWQASNSVNLTLRDINQASALTDLLQGLGATNVSGPSFSLDDTTQFQAALLQTAIDNAREKATVVAKASRRRLGKILTVSEGGTSAPRPVFMSAKAEVGGVPAPIEPGTETVSKTVTVTFELK
ncbi:MAG: SIMPL domain-containing protein [Candidatus Beckwithbacteria bacterium]|nr:SIMPL domain-containing protein [Candidatus Beckwithbacteria bacterium]